MAKFRTVRDLRNTLETTATAFEDAIEDAQSRELPESKYDNLAISQVFSLLPKYIISSERGDEKVNGGDSPEECRK